MSASYKDFLITLLANDAYNRGAFVNVVVDTDVIGTATRLPNLGEKLTAAELDAYLNFGPNTFTLLSAADVGFNATAYTLGSGETVIAYRGTDFRTSFSDGQIKELLKDIFAGWSSGFGIAEVPNVNLGVLGQVNIPLQTSYAELFYQQIIKSDPFDNTGSANVILTGHSLGGGLAGYIGMFSGAPQSGFAANDNVALRYNEKMRRVGCDIQN